MCSGDSDSEGARNQSPVPNEPAAPLDCCGGFSNVDYSKVFRGDTRFKASVHVESAHKSV